MPRNLAEKLEGSAQVKIRGLVTLGSQVEELKQTVKESLQGLGDEHDGEMERDADVLLLKGQIRMLKEERSHLQAICPKAEDGNTLVKYFSHTQAEINRLQREIQDLQGLQLTDSRTELQSVHSGLRAQEESQSGTGDSAGFTPSLPESEGHLRKLQAERLRSASTLQRRAEKQPMSGGNTPEDCLSVVSLDSRLSGYHSATRQSYPHAFPGQFGREDSVARAVLDCLVHQNQNLGQELGMQIMRALKMEEMLAVADEQKAIMVSESQLAIEELQDFLSAKDKLLNELTEDCSQLKEEKSRLQNLFYETEQGKKLPKESFHQTQPEINKLKGERQDFQRKRLTNSHPELQSLHMERKAHEESQPRPEHQNTATQTGPAATEGAAHLRTEYMTKSFKV
ncbi:hypothetical protein AAFF_G00275180 [Aldrovandia affinis]|uniref:Uncharacterized protein n=1 Tax=Aldrovandia affinis TaxID=143900 RepID=A0AAD7STT4_9TELE|nr:hypothetical protein AAFF_G00275180 [Aldrovandia affinis]